MNWKSTLKSRGYLISDGAWGTELVKLGMGAGEVAELWNVDHPDLVERVAHSYVEAGCDILLTNSFSGTPWKLERLGLAERLVELNRAAAEISHRAAGDRAMVFASVGPTGEMMAPLGTRTEEEFIACFARQIEAFLPAGIDGLVVETMTDLGEAVAALKAARQVAPRLPVVVSMTFDRLAGGGYATVMGVRPDRAAAALEAAGADVVGANCGAGIDQMIEVARTLRTGTGLPLWLKSNAGLPALVDGRTIFRETPEAMASRVQELIEAGANIIGGCCGTTPEHIHALAAAAAEARETTLRVGSDVLARL